MKNFPPAPTFEKNIQENKDWNSTGGWSGTTLNHLREKHPREQGLKLYFIPRFVFADWASRKTSKRTRIETGVRGKVLLIRFPSRKTSKRTRIETRKTRFEEEYGVLREKHPREQGLKPCRFHRSMLSGVSFEKNIQENKDWNQERWLPPIYSRRLREKHPREQGLKLITGENNHGKRRTSRKTSKRTRIETAPDPEQGRDYHLREKHPREQGLKQNMGFNTLFSIELREKHPREQGLKPARLAQDLPQISFEKNIQENKDWN